MALELNTQTCGTKGNVVFWNSLQEQGSSTRTEASLPDCDGEYNINSFIKSMFIATFLNLCTCTCNIKLFI